MSGTFKTASAVAASVHGMNLQLSLIELVVADMAATLAFYRRVGLGIPPDAGQQPHVDWPSGATARPRSTRPMPT